MLLCFKQEKQDNLTEPFLVAIIIYGTDIISAN